MIERIPPYERCDAQEPFVGPYRELHARLRERPRPTVPGAGHRDR